MVPCSHPAVVHDGSRPHIYGQHMLDYGLRSGARLPIIASLEVGESQLYMIDARYAVLNTSERQEEII